MPEKQRCKSRRRPVLSKRRLILWGGLILSLVYVFIFGPYGYIIRHQKQSQIRQLMTQIERVEEENKSLKREAVELEENPLKIEEEAREELGMVLPGEWPVELIGQGQKE